jgi:hypothetical protein
MECRICGRPTEIVLGGVPVCEECYQNAGSCCLEFGGEDLWAEREEPKGHPVPILRFPLVQTRPADAWPFATQPLGKLEINSTVTPGRDRGKMTVN